MLIFFRSPHCRRVSPNNICTVYAYKSIPFLFNLSWSFNKHAEGRVEARDRQRPARSAPGDQESLVGGVDAVHGGMFHMGEVVAPFFS